MRHTSALPLEPTPANNAVEFFQPQDVFEAFDALAHRNLRPTLTMLDPWYNKGMGGVIDNYDAFISELLARACAVSRHVYLWGFPEIIGPYVRNVPRSHELVAWLTWFYKNNPSVIRGWRSSQMACLHIAEPDAPLYPQNFLNKVQRERFAKGTLRYVPGPTSVIESALLIGFVGKKEQTGHPAQKPVAVYDKLVRMVTAEGDLIFDPMCGSGTTGVVALIRSRQAILSDMNEDYLNMARRRLLDDYSGWAERLDLAGNNPEKPRGAQSLDEQAVALL
jgi:site-specific DNA-methyltransferase (adenine-specific)